MTAATERDVEAVYAACERFVSGDRPEWRTPKAMLERLAANLDAGARADRYGRGELVERLERRVADLLGKDAAVFFVSGTMAQQIALRVHADRRRSRGVAFHATAHLQLYEQFAHEHLHGLHSVIVGSPHRLIERADLEAIAEPVAALLLELPQRELGGRLPEWDDLLAQADWARVRDIALHLDGARLWEAAPYYGRSHAEIAALFETVYVSFYKGLGGVAGCALAGPAELLEEARVWAIRHGGRVFSLYPQVLSAELGLDRALPQMEACYGHAAALGAELAKRDWIDVVPDPPQTPMLHVYLRGDRERLVEAALDVAEERRTWLFGPLADSPLPELHKAELQVCEPGLEVTAEEAGALFDEVRERAAR
jgi:threonine aldolase